jgi:hypothetical protein
MKKSKKHRSLSPRHKRMNREQRLKSARSWLSSYNGSHVVRSYRDRYGVDWLCAVKELGELGIATDPEYIRKLKEEQRRESVKKELAVMKRIRERMIDSDEHYFFIAGYTSGGAPFGVTWEEARTNGLMGKDDIDDRRS